MEKILLDKSKNDKEQPLELSTLSVSEKYRAFYDNFYTVDGSEWRDLVAIDKVKNIISLCSNYPHKSILEVGSGEGAILQGLCKLKFGDKLYSLEISKNSLKSIQQRNIQSLVEFNIFDGYNIPYKDNKFDLVILSHVVEHLEFPRKLLYEASRVGNLVFVEIPLSDNYRLKRSFPQEFKIGHINFYSPRTIKYLLQTCGLRILSQKITNFSYRAHINMFGSTKGIMAFIIKELTFRLIPFRTRLWNYNYSSISTKLRDLKY